MSEMSREAIAWEIEGLLECLGNSAEEVRETLADWGFKGVPGILNGCPVEKYLEQHGWVVSVTEDDVHVLIPWAKWDKWLEVPLPQAVVEFLDAFHEGCYPELVEERETVQLW